MREKKNDGRYGLIMHEWLTIEERKQIYRTIEKANELRDEMRKKLKGFEMEYEVEGDKVKIGKSKYSWSEGKWRKCEE